MPTLKLNNHKEQSVSKKLIVVLGDQLSENMSSFNGIDKQRDVILMCEVREEATYVKHHKKKIAFIFSAMRHFAAQLKDNGYNIRYTKYSDKDNQGSILSQVEHNIRQQEKDEPFDKVVIAKPGEYRLFDEIKTWGNKLNIEIEITPDNRFIASEETFNQWTKGKKQLRMEFFYREMRKQSRYLMDGNEPSGGKWNFDAKNREKFPKGASLPQPTKFETDAITEEVLELVKDEFSDHFGNIDEFHYAVDREQALIVLDEFIEQRLENFGRYQDAMVQDEAWMYHGHVSFYINVGLLSPQEVMDAAQSAYDQGKAPINSVEGFIRQILGWREYVRGFYWFFMPGLKEDNFMDAKRNLPAFFWTADTDMNCLQQCVQQTEQNAYAHHIQRLMVLGNFALLAGIDPKFVNEWYLIVYADAYEWVELPNVSGMILYSDGGKLASKPYAASGSYIHKMSNYCAHCKYSVKEKSGEQACPFNYLYWDFINRHRDKFEKNPRMAMIYRTMAKMNSEKLETMLSDSELFFTRLDNNEKV